MRKRRLSLVLTIAASLFGVANVSRADFAWTGAVSNDLTLNTVPGNWVDSVSGLDTALTGARTYRLIFNQGVIGAFGELAPVTMDVPNAFQPRLLTFNNPAATPVNFIGVQQIRIGNSGGEGFLTANDGDVTFSNLKLGFHSGENGIVVQGTSTVTVNTTGTLSMANSNGVVASGSLYVKNVFDTAPASVLTGGNIVVNPAVDYSAATPNLAMTLFLNSYGLHTISLNGGIMGHATKVLNIVVNNDDGTGDSFAPAIARHVVAEENGTVLIGGTSNPNGTTTVGNGTLVLTGTYDDSGSTTINSLATLQIGNGGAAGSIGGANSDIVNNGTLKFNHTATLDSPLVFANAISGTGGLTNNAGATNLTGNNTYSGNRLRRGRLLAVLGQRRGRRRASAAVDPPGGRPPQLAGLRERTSRQRPRPSTPWRPGRRRGGRHAGACAPRGRPRQARLAWRRRSTTSTWSPTSTQARRPRPRRGAPGGGGPARPDRRPGGRTERVVLVGTGRAEPSAAERGGLAELGRAHLS